MKRIPVLVVDDEPEITALFSDILKQRGYEVFIASSGESAICIAERNRPSIAFIDIRMPGGIDGVELVRRIRSKSLCKRIIMMTGYSRDDRVEAAMRLGAFACLMKPFGTREIIDMTEITLLSA
jgi:DNA-binding response OmpR family regulator